MRTLVPFCALVFVAVAAAAGDEVVIQGYIAPRNIAPAVDHGYLAVYETGGIAVYAPDGSLTARIGSPAGAAIINADMDSDGSIATAVEAYRPMTGTISFFGRDGMPNGQIVTGEYIPSQVCFAPDRSIWTLGSEESQPSGERADYFLLRHYSRGGGLLGQFLARSSFPSAIDPGLAAMGLGAIRIADGRIGVMLSNAGETRHNLWLELGLDGKELGRWTGSDAAQMPRAMTASGAVYAQGKGLYMLDRASGSWKPVPRSSNGSLLGADGDTLIFAVPGMNRIRRAAQP